MKPVVLIILDGWGIAEKNPGNVITQAKLPAISEIEKSFPFLLLQASGKSLGLLWGEQGNDEIGHFCVGTGNTEIKKEKTQNSLSEIISKSGLKQLKISETIKFECLTYFFNGKNKSPFAGEERIAVPTVSIRDFSLWPQMRTEEITDQILENLEQYNFIAANFAAPDIIGHSGNLKAAITAVEIIDKGLGEIMKKILEINGTLIITSDHGKIEKMLDSRTGHPFKENTTNPVPFYLIDYKFKKEKRLKEISAIKKSIPTGIITDIAPTILELMKIEKPEEMTGKSLLPLIG